nr:MAG: putative maturation protein [Leviviridae sp.]
MYVPAPHLHGTGATSVTQEAMVRVGGSGYLSLEEAIDQASIMNEFRQNPFGLTVKSGESGIVGYKEYVDTAYTARYLVMHPPVGRVVSVFQHGSLYYPANHFVGFGYLGFHDTGYDVFLGDLSPWGTSLSIEAIATRVMMDNLVKRSVVECLNKMRDKKMDLAETLTGLRPAVRMVADRVTQVVKAYVAIRSGNWSGAVRALGLSKPRPRGLRDASSLWLELQYGWLPMLNDIYGAVELIKDLLTKEPEKPHYTVTRRLTQGGLLFRGPVTSGSPWDTVNISTDSTGRVETKFKFRVSDPNLAFISSLALSNPLYVGWVALPFSFVIDWLVPIGPWLEALTAHHGLQFVGGYSTVQTYGRAVVKVRGRNTGIFPKVFEQGESSATAEQLCVQRIPYLGFPYPQPYVRFPFSSETRVANAIALIATARK